MPIVPKLKRSRLPATKATRRRCYGITSNLRRCGRTGPWRLYCRDHVFQPWLFAASTIFALAFTVLPGLDFWTSKINREDQFNPQEVRQHLQELRTAGQFMELQSFLLKLEGRPEFSEDVNFYNLYLVTISPGVDGATEPDFYFDRIDPGSMGYGQAIRHIASYYLKSAGSWSAAKPKFAELYRKIEQSGRILPQKFFVEMMAMGPDAKYNDIYELYQRVMDSYGKNLYADGTIIFAFDIDGPFPAKANVDLMQIPPLLLLIYQEMSIAAAKECRQGEMQQAIQKANDIAAGPMFANDASSIITFEDDFFAAGNILRDQPKRFSDVRAAAACR